MADEKTTTSPPAAAATAAEVEDDEQQLGESKENKEIGKMSAYKEEAELDASKLNTASFDRITSLSKDTAAAGIKKAAEK